MKKNKLKDIRLQQYLMSEKLKKKYSPFADTDKDGFVNMMDCYPFDKNKHGRIWDWIKRRVTKPKPTSTVTTIAPTTTAVRSVDIVGRTGTSAQGTGGSITVKGKTAWVGGGSSSSGEPATQVNVTGVNVDPETILAFGERQGIVDTTPAPAPAPEPVIPATTPTPQKKTWLGGIIRTGTGFGFAPEVVSAYQGVKTLATATGERARQRNLALIRKYNEGKELNKWEISKLRDLDYDIGERYPEKKGGWSITEKFFTFATAGFDKTGKYTEGVQFYERGERDKLIREKIKELDPVYAEKYQKLFEKEYSNKIQQGEITYEDAVKRFMNSEGAKQIERNYKKTIKSVAPTSSVGNAIIGFADYIFKLGIFGSYLRTGATGQKEGQMFEKLSSKEKLKAYIKSLEERAVYDKAGTKKAYAEIVKRFGKNSKEAKAYENLIRGVLSKKEATKLFKDALQPEVVTFGQSKFSGLDVQGGIEGFTDTGKIGDIGLIEGKIPTGVLSDVPVMKNVEAVAGGSKALENVFNLFNLNVKTDVKEQQKINYGQLTGGLTITKTKLTFKQPQVPTFVPAFGTPQITKQPQVPKFPTPFPTPTITKVPKYKPPKPPKAPKFPSFLIGFNDKGKGKTKYKKQKDYIKALKKAYQPSVGAVVLGIKATKKPKRITGLGLRPIIISKKRKSIKRKKTNYLQNVNKILG